MHNVTFHSQVVSTEDVPAGMTELDIVNTANYFREETPTWWIFLLFEYWKTKQVKMALKKPRA